MNTVRSFFYLLLISLFTYVSAQSQSFIFGPKLGPSACFQQWNGFEQDVLFSFHGAVFIESYDAESTSSLYAQAGYFTRGSALRVNDFFSGFSSSQGFEFNNLSVTLGAKRILKDEGTLRPFYTVGIRGDYTLSTNLSDYEQFQSAFYPNNEFVNKINYGLSIGGGFQYDLSEFVGGALEITINPDVSKQYEQPGGITVINPFTGNTNNLQARDIRNLSIDISLSIRFLRKVEYY